MKKVEAESRAPHWGSFFSLLLKIFISPQQQSAAPSSP
jgi:hypothetical protein